ncbi:MAG: hypothetical protein QOK05_1678 [Chloroflexota bacterium]|jgi:heavy metal sensor kinase|nr:hypothetical protein [Chloroflexota bacterium]
MRRAMRRTRVRLTAAYTTVFTVVAIVGATAFWFAFQQAEMSAVDDSLYAQADSVLSGLDEAGGRVTFQGSDSLPNESPDGIAIAATLVGPGGVALDRSGQGPKVSDVASLVAAAGAAGKAEVTTAVVAGQRQRVLVKPVQLPTGGNGSLVMTRPTGELDDTLARTALFLAMGVVIMAVAASGAGYLLAGRALRPVRQIAATARDLSERDLHRRIDLELPDDELGELADTFNGMLARLEGSFDSLRRFTADAAHDLRAPLALLMVEVDVALKRSRDPESYRESLESVRAEGLRLGRMVDQLLVLARADAGALELHLAALDLPDLLEETIARWRSMAAQKGVVLATSLPDTGTLQGDADLLRRMLDNILDNAVRNTPAGGSVHISCERAGDGWSIAIEDTGPGVSAALRPTLFDRFTRADPARGRETGGAGLGLSLADTIARLHGGQVVLADSAGGARFVVSLRERPMG